MASYMLPHLILSTQNYNTGSTISVLKTERLSWGSERFHNVPSPPEVQEQASSWMVTKVRITDTWWGREWKLTGKGPRGTFWGGSVLNLDLDLDRPHRYVPGKDFIKLYTKILPFMYLHLKLGKKIECLHLKSHSEDPHIEARCPGLQSLRSHLYFHRFRGKEWE